MKRGGAFYNNCKIYSLINLKQNPTNALISSICGDLTLAGVVRLEWLRPLAVSGFCRRGLLGTNRPLRFTSSLHLPQGAHRRFTRSRSACREFIKYINPYKNKKRCPDGHLSCFGRGSKTWTHGTRFWRPLLKYAVSYVFTPFISNGNLLILQFILQYK